MIRPQPAASQHLHQEQADHAGADDYGRVAEADMRAVDGMNGDGDRLDHRGMSKAERIGEVIEDVPRHGDVLGESTLAAAFLARYAEYLATVAEIDLPPAAKPAFSAVDRRVERHALAFRPLVDVVAEPGNHARGLVAHDDRRPSAAGTAVHAMHVAAADAAGGHFEQHVVRPDLRQRPLLQFKTIVCGQYEGFHWILVGRISKSVQSSGTD